MTTDQNDFLFQDEESSEQNNAPKNDKHWKVLVVDDEADIHSSMKLVLDNLQYAGQELQIIDAYSAAQAKEILITEKNIAVAFLDVVMETNEAGLDLVNYIRNELKNQAIRIIVLTGQPGFAPETDVIKKYEINDYRTKTDLTNKRMVTMALTALRAYDAISRVEIQNAELEIKVKERTLSLEEKTIELTLTNFELEKLSLVAKKVENAVSILDADGNFEWVNAGFERLYEINYEELLKDYGYNIFESILVSYNNSNSVEQIENGAKIISNIKSALQQKTGIAYEFETTAKSGKKVFVHTTLTPIFDYNGNISKLICIDSDITKIKEAELIIKTQNKSIEDSIKYAQFIQQAVLPDHHHHATDRNNYFLIYKPRDIVSGDFYWIKQFGENLVIAIADCTGHGVPGALMSMLGISALNEVFATNCVFKAHAILNDLRLRMIKMLQVSDFGKNNSEKLQLRDGIHMALCIINTTTLELSFAGAYNPVWIVEKCHGESQQPELTELKGDKFPIGIHEKEFNSFKNQEFQLQKGDLLYIFTDGFQDQFGGTSLREGGKKYNAKNVKKLLLNLAPLPLMNQKQKLETELHEWMNPGALANNETFAQVDDITAFGIKI